MALYLVAALQWGVLAPLNLLKLLRNTTSPWARNWVPQESEECQRDCGIARMWATLFWSSQLALAIGYFVIYRTGKGKLPFVYVGVCQKALVGAFLLKAYAEGVVKWPIGLAGGLDWLMAAALLRDALADTTGSDPEGPVRASSGSDTVTRLRQFAARWWFPWLIGASSGLNIFVVVLVAPTTLLYLSAILARPSRAYYTAAVNAVGTAIGAACLVYLVHQNGTQYLTSAFPSFFAADEWVRTKAIVQQYGLAGTAIIAALPIALQPLILFAALAGLDPLVVVACILVGRTVKYSVMAWSLLSAPALLKLFGVRQASLESLHAKQL